MQGVAAHCQWRAGNDTSLLTITSGTEFAVGGLEGLYLVRDAFPVFEPGELDGFPTVRADAQPGTTFCTLYVGVADDQLIWATVGIAVGPVPACDVAREMASMVLSNLPPLR